MGAVRDELKALFAIDQKLIAIKQRLNAGPKELQQRTRAVETAKAAKNEIATRIREAATGVDRFSLDVQSAEAEIAELQEKMHIIKNNKEYKIITERIKDLKQQISENEDKEIRAMEELDALRQTLKEKQQSLAEAEEKCEVKQAEMDALAASVKDDQRALAAQRKAQIAKVDAANPTAMEVYSQALHRGKGIALATLKQKACQVCFRTQNPNVINLVLLGQDLDKCICAGCGRILIADQAELPGSDA